MKKFNTLLTFFACILLSCKSDINLKENSISQEVNLSASASAAITYNYLVGTYTSNSNQGINYVQFTPSTNSFVLKSVISGISNPSFVIANKSKSIVVAVEETSSATGGKVTSFKYNATTKVFTKINSVFTKGDSPCTVTFSPDEKYVMVGNYTGGNLAVFPISLLGVLSDNIQIVQHTGTSVNASRQEKPHVHDVVFHPTESKIFIADLGNDSIQLIPFTSGGSPVLNANGAVTINVNAGAGPRHLLFNKTGSILYVICELTNQVLVYNYAVGQLTFSSSINLISATTNGSAAELRLSLDGNFLYASVRGTDNKIVAMAVNSNGSLTKIQTISTGKTPRCFILTPDEKNILISNQDSNNLSVLVRNTTTGLLSSNLNTITINKPVYLYLF